jgi:hypothetical protein
MPQVKGGKTQYLLVALFAHGDKASLQVPAGVRAEDQDHR